MIQYSNFSSATFGLFTIVATGDLASLQQQLDQIHAENEKAPINLKRSSKGKVPSEYVILKHGVYRLADHWNNVGNSFWLLDGTESTQVCYKKLCLAYCAFENMEHTFVALNNIISGTYQNDRLAEIIHKTTMIREKQWNRKKAPESVADAVPELI